MVMYVFQIIDATRVAGHSYIMDQHVHAEAGIFLQTGHGLLFLVDPLVGDEQAGKPAEQQEADDHGDHDLYEGKAVLLFQLCFHTQLHCSLESPQ